MRDNHHRGEEGSSQKDQLANDEMVSTHHMGGGAWKFELFLQLAGGLAICPN